VLTLNVVSDKRVCI